MLPLTYQLVLAIDVDLVLRHEIAITQLIAHLLFHINLLVPVGEIVVRIRYAYTIWLLAPEELQHG